MEKKGYLIDPALNDEVEKNYLIFAEGYLVQAFDLNQEHVISSGEITQTHLEKFSQVSYCVKQNRGDLAKVLENMDRNAYDYIQTITYIKLTDSEGKPLYVKMFDYHHKLLVYKGKGSVHYKKEGKTLFGKSVYHDVELCVSMHYDHVQVNYPKKPNVQEIRKYKLSAEERASFERYILSLVAGFEYLQKYVPDAVTGSTASDFAAVLVDGVAQIPSYQTTLEQSEAYIRHLSSTLEQIYACALDLFWMIYKKDQEFIDNLLGHQDTVREETMADMKIIKDYYEEVGKIQKPIVEEMNGVSTEREQE